jgi:hypothetical protein
MDPTRRAIYKEWSSWPGWLLVMFWGTMLLTLGLVLASPGESEQERQVGVAVIAGAMVGVQWLVAGLSVRLYRDWMTVGLGSSGWISKKIPYADIQRTESVTYSPMSEFGGWGVRWGKDGKVAWTARGNHAVVLHLSNGTRLYVGSDTPHRLEERIRAVAGNRIGVNPGATHG